MSRSDAKPPTTPARPESTTASVTSVPKISFLEKPRALSTAISPSRSRTDMLAVLAAMKTMQSATSDVTMRMMVTKP